MRPNLLFAGIILLCCSPATADQTKPDTIAVMGEAEVLLAPDFAKIEVGVVTQGPVVADALAINSEKMTHVVEALRGLNIPDKDIQTSNFSIMPKYEKAASGDYDSSEMRAIVGYYIIGRGDGL